MIDQSSWGWFQFDERKNNFIQNLKKISSSIRSIPNIEQGIYFTKRLYFSVEVLENLEYLHSMNYQKDFIQELIHKIHFQLL